MKLSQLIIDLNTGIDGGEYSLMELISYVFDKINKSEKIATEIEIEIKDGTRTMKMSEGGFEDVQDVIRKVQEELGKLENSTTQDFPKAIQDAFDRSEKFHSDTKELHHILNEMKTILSDYENNLINAKLLTNDAKESLALIDEKMTENEKLEKEIQLMFKVFGDKKISYSDFENAAKLAQKATDQVNSVFDNAFDLLHEVSIFDVDGKFSEISKKVAELENENMKNDKSLKEFIDESNEFLDKLESDLDKATKLENKALKQIDDIREYLKEAEGKEKIILMENFNYNFISFSSKENC